MNFCRVSSATSANRIRYMRFKPYYGSLSQKNTQLIDRGYYFKLVNCNILIVRSVLEENGFVEQDSKGPEFTVLWCIGPIKSEIYQSLSFYQKVLFDEFSSSDGVIS